MTLSFPLTLTPKTLLRAWPLSLSLGVAAFGVNTSAPVAAQPAGQSAAKAPVSIELQAFKVVRGADGKEQLQSASRARPGDVLEYRAVYANKSSKEVKNLQATLPIPASTQVVLESASPKSVNASRDGRNFAPAPLMQVVTLANGTTKKQPVPLSAYREPTGQIVTVRARVRLNSTLSSN